MNVSIVMYHYVRELDYSRYPEIKGLTVNLFKEQISYMRKYYNIISACQLMDAVYHGAELPSRPLLLTFDDGYIDHFNVVFPVLDQYKLAACFFPSPKCILEHRVLNVNKIHFILASVSDKKVLIHRVLQAIDRYRTSYKLKSNEEYFCRCWLPGRYDSADVNFLKNLLQRDLPESLRDTIIDELFKEFVSKDERAFANEIYMNLDQITCLQRNGMYIGSHGFDHYWLNSLSPNDQEREIELSLDFLKMIGSDTKRWIMCYPYGAYNENLLTILKKNNCILGLTVEVDIADLQRDNPLTLPRLNTNDLPKDSKSEPNEWTKKVLDESIVHAT